MGEASKQAEKEAKRAMRLSYLWWVQVPIISVVYWLISKEPMIEKVILTYLADVSIIANAVSYASKAKALEAKAAGQSS